jgi:hypothetical protein
MEIQVQRSNYSHQPTYAYTIQRKHKLCKAVSVTSCEWSDTFISPVHISNIKQGRYCGTYSEPELFSV